MVVFFSGKFVCALLSIRLNMLQDRRLKQRAGSMSQGRSKPLAPTNQRQQSAGMDLSFVESKEKEPNLPGEGQEQFEGGLASAHLNTIA